MSGIFNGIQAILNGLMGPLNLLKLIITEIIQFGEIILATITQITTNITLLPPIVYKYTILSISIIIVLRVLGRSTE